LQTYPTIAGGWDTFALAKEINLRYILDTLRGFDTGAFDYGLNYLEITMQR
jgi:hypothetical protein